MSFLNPGLLAGALLFAVPLIIHLLNRQRHKRRPWAAMEFLLRAYQKTRNRLRNENLLLLLLRCLIPIVLAFAIARPVMRQVAALLGQTGTIHHYVVLDASYSMGFQQGGQSPFERGRALVGRLLERMQDHRERGDKLTIVTAGVRPRFVVRDEQDPTLARAQWLDVQRTEDGAGDLVEAVSQTQKAIEEGHDDQVQVYIVTDLQTRAFGRLLQTGDKAAAPAFNDSLRDLQEQLQKRERTAVHWIDVGPFAEQQAGGTADNVQIKGLRLQQPFAVARVPLTVVVALQNRGTTNATAQVTLEIDGGEPSRKAVALAPGAEGEAEFQLTLRETGRRRLRASLVADGLEADDDWCTALDVRERVRVLVVDGLFGGDPLRGYGWFYRAILDPQSLGDDPTGGTDAELSKYEVTTAETLALLSGQQSPLNYDLTILADVDRLNERAAADLTRALQAGKGLLVALGRNADLESYNTWLAGADDGPMPLRLLRRAGSPRADAVARKPQIATPNHPLLREFEEETYRVILQEIPVYQWLAMSPGSLRDGTDVVLRLTDRDQSPLLTASTFGEGRVAIFTSAPGSEFDKDRWNRLEDRFIVYPLIHGIAQWLALPAEDPFNVSVGAALSCSLPARPVDVEVVLSERAGSAKQPVVEESKALPGGRYSLPLFSGTTMAGFYGVDLHLERESGREPVSLTFGVHVDPEEGLLQYAAHDQVRQALGIERVLTTLPSEGNSSTDPGGSEFGPSLLALLVALLVGEAAMARYVSVRRI